MKGANIFLIKYRINPSFMTSSEVQPLSSLLTLRLCRSVGLFNLTQQHNSGLCPYNRYTVNSRYNEVLGTCKFLRYIRIIINAFVCDELFLKYLLSGNIN